MRDAYGNISASKFDVNYTKYTVRDSSNKS